MKYIKMNFFNTYIKNQRYFQESQNNEKMIEY